MDSDAGADVEDLWSAMGVGVAAYSGVAPVVVVGIFEVVGRGPPAPIEGMDEVAVVMGLVDG